MRPEQGSTRCARVLGRLALVALAGAAAGAQDETRWAGHWEGSIEIPNAPLAVKVDLAQADGAWTGTIDIPAQSAVGLPLAGLRIDGETVEFAIADVPGNPTFKGRGSDAGIAGTFSQGGVDFPFALTRDAVAGPSRPQTPQPPFPYSSEDAAFTNGDVHLAGTLTVPAGEPPFPAVLLVSGSGLQNRDQELFGHKPFWVLADHLSRAGIAVLRVDDAGAGESSAHPQSPTTADFAADAGAAVEHLKKDARISSIGLLGHSEGGAIATLLASRRDDVAFAVLLAAPGVEGAALMRKQNERIFAAVGIVGERRDALLELLDELFAALVSDESDAQLRPQVESVVRRQMAANGIAAEQQDDAQVQAAVASALNPWMRHFLRLDPRPALLATKVPVLALNGALDVQVDAEQNLGAIRDALREGGNDNATVRSLPGLNHLFQRAQTGLIDEYGRIEETISPEVLDLIRDWILAQQ